MLNVLYAPVTRVQALGALLILCSVVSLSGCRSHECRVLDKAYNGAYTRAVAATSDGAFAEAKRDADALYRTIQLTCPNP